MVQATQVQNHNVACGLVQSVSDSFEFDSFRFEDATSQSKSFSTIPFNCLSQLLISDYSVVKKPVRMLLPSKRLKKSTRESLDKRQKSSKRQKMSHAACNSPSSTIAACNVWLSEGESSIRGRRVEPTCHPCSRSAAFTGIGLVVTNRALNRGKS